jgi:hypothetical protein
MQYGLGFALILGLLTGCTSTLISEGQAVKIINANMAIECEFIAFMYEDISRGRSASHENNNVMLDVRNKAAEMGADSVEIVDTGFDITVSGLVKVNAYKCDS